MAAIAILRTTLADNAPAATSGVPLSIIPPGEQPRAGPATNFVGDVTVTFAFKGTSGSRLGGATVSFQRGARSNWHVHPLGQLLVVTQGEGMVQDEGGAPRRINAGDTVWTAPGVKHWHGASPTRAMTHVAITEALAVQNVTWLEPVTDAGYREANAAAR